MTCIKINNQSALIERLIADGKAEVVLSLTNFDVMDSVTGNLSLDLNLTDTISLKDVILVDDINDLNIVNVEELNDGLKKVLNTTENVVYEIDGKYFLTETLQSIKDKISNAINKEYVKTQAFADTSPNLMISEPIIDKVVTEITQTTKQLRELYGEKQTILKKYDPNLARVRDIDNQIEKLQIFATEARTYVDELRSNLNFDRIFSRYVEDRNLVNTLLEGSAKIDVDQLNKLSAIADFWYQVQDPDTNILELQSEKKNPNIQAKLMEIHEFVSVLENKLFKMRVNKGISTVNKQFTKDQDASFLTNFSKDDTKWTTYFKGWHKSQNPIIQGIAQLVNKTVDKALSMYKTVEKNIQNAYDKIAPKIGTDFKIFIAKDENGNLVYQLVDRYSFKYWSTIRAFDTSTNAGRRGRRKFITDNSIVANFRYLFDETSDIIPDNDLMDKTTQAQKDVFKARLVEDLTEDGFNEMFDKISEIIADYQIKRDNAYALYVGEESKLTMEKAQKFENWMKDNSPFRQSKLVASGKKVNFRKINNEFIIRVPRRFDKNGDETGFYDKDFEHINADADLKAFYKIARDVMDEARHNFDYELGTHPFVLPYLEKSLMQQVFSKGSTMGESFNKIGQAALQTLGGKEDRDIATTEIKIYDPKKRQLIKRKINKKVTTIEDKANEIAKLEIINQEGKLERSLTYKEIQEITGKALQEAGKNQDLDLVKLLNLLAVNSLLYKHKKMIDSEVSLMSELFYNQNRDPKTDRMLTESAKFLENTLNSDFYGISTKIVRGDVLSFFGKKGFLNAKKRKIVKLLEGKLDEIQLKIKRLQLGDGEEDNSVELKKLKNEVRKINKQILDQYDKIFLSEAIRGFIAYSRLLGIGYNVIAGVKNFMFGQVSNFQRALQGDKFTRADLKEAMKLLVSDRTKINNITQKVGLVGDVAYLAKKPTDPSKSTTTKFWRKAKQWLSPYEITVAVEEYNQNPILVAMLRNVSVSTDQVSETNPAVSTLYDIMDEDGNVNESYKDINNLSGEDLLAFVMQEVRKTIKETHGDYNSTLMANNEEWLSAALMYRRWLPEMLDRRFGNDSIDFVTNTNKEGVYTTLLKAIGPSLAAKSVDSLTDDEKGRIKSVVYGDIAILLLLFVMGNMMKHLLCDDPDCKDASAPLYFSLNIMKGVSDEIAFFHIKNGFGSLIDSPFPQTRTVDDILRAFATMPAIWNKSSTSSYYRSGRNKGKNKGITNIFKLIPGLNQMYRLAVYGNAPIYTKQWGNLWFTEN